MPRLGHRIDAFEVGIAWDVQKPCSPWNCIGAVRNLRRRTGDVEFTRDCAPSRFDRVQ